MPCIRAIIEIIDEDTAKAQWHHAMPMVDPKIPKGADRTAPRLRTIPSPTMLIEVRNKEGMRYMFQNLGRLVPFDRYGDGRATTLWKLRRTIVTNDQIMNLQNGSGIWCDTIARHSWVDIMDPTSQLVKNLIEGLNITTDPLRNTAARNRERHMLKLENSTLSKRAGPSR